MAVKIPKDTLQAIVDDFTINNLTIGEISTMYGYSTSSVSRALADAGVHSLSNYKTKEEDRMCQLLQAKGIRTAAELSKVLRDYKPT